MFCGYGCIQCAADAITCVLCIVYAVSKSGKKRRDFAMLAAYYFVQGVIHYVVFYWGNKLYIHKGFDARAVHPEARAARRRRGKQCPSPPPRVSRTRASRRRRMRTSRPGCALGPVTQDRGRRRRRPARRTPRRRRQWTHAP